MVGPVPLVPDDGEGHGGDEHDVDDGSQDTQSHGPVELVNLLKKK